MKIEGKLLCVGRGGLFDGDLELSGIVAVDLVDGVLGLIRMRELDDGLLGGEGAQLDKRHDGGGGLGGQLV